MEDPLQLFKALSDEGRGRILRAILHSELSVAELVEALGMPQSTVSRHLRPLREAGLVQSRREGTSIYYRAGPRLQDDILNQFVTSHLEEVEMKAADLAAVQEALHRRKERSRAFFERMAGQYSRFTEPGGGWAALAAGVAAGFRDRHVVDCGAGEGDLSLVLARFARCVTAVDHSKGMLKQLMEKARSAGVGDRIEVVEGDLESLPISDEQADAVFLSQALHHTAQPPVALEEATRVLRPSGQLIVLDLLKHEEEWVRDEWADQWLGFTPHELEEWLHRGPLSQVRTEILPVPQGKFAVVLATAERRSEEPPGSSADVRSVSHVIRSSESDVEEASEEETDHVVFQDGDNQLCENPISNTKEERP